VASWAEAQSLHSRREEETLRFLSKSKKRCLLSTPGRLDVWHCMLPRDEGEQIVALVQFPVVWGHGALNPRSKYGYRAASNLESAPPLYGCVRSDTRIDRYASPLLMEHRTNTINRKDY